MAIVYHRDAIHVYLAPDEARSVSTNFRPVGAGGVEIRVVNRNAWREYCQIIETAAVDRQTLDTLLVNHTGDRGAFGLQQRNAACDFDGFLHCTNLEFEIDAGFLAQLDHDARPAFAAKPVRA